MKVKKLLKVISPDTDIIFCDNYGGRERICTSINTREIYLERKVEKVWIDTYAFSTLNITIEGTID